MASKSDEILELKAVAVASFASLLGDNNAVDVGSPNNDYRTGAEISMDSQSRIQKSDGILTSSKQNLSLNMSSGDIANFDSVESAPMIFSPPSSSKSIVLKPGNIFVTIDCKSIPVETNESYEQKFLHY
jgi:hypothetical protein